MRAEKWFGWSKAELIVKTVSEVREMLELVVNGEANYHDNEKNHRVHGYLYLVSLIIGKFLSWERCGINHRRCLVFADNTC